MRRICVVKQLVLFCSIVFLFTSCNFNKSETVKDKRECSVDIKEQKDSNKKNNENSKSSESTQEENISIRNNKITLLEKQIEYNSVAIELNNKAMNDITYSIFPVTSKDTLLLRKSIVLLNKAISIDTMYFLAYANKAMVLRRLNKNKEALQTLRIITKLKPDYAEGFSSLGFAYEKLGSIDSANVCYKSAIIAYNKRIQQTNNINDKLSSAFILSLIDKEKGLQQMDYLIDDNPDNESIVFWKQQLFDDFDREKFISNQ